jgi:hypothetical protein
MDLDEDPVIGAVGWRIPAPSFAVEPLIDPGPGGKRRDGGEVAVEDPTANPR